MLVMLNCAMLKSWERRKGKMDLHKFGIKLFIKNTNNYSSKKFIPIFHKWIQNKSIPNHLLIDVADYSHIVDGPGIMLVAHEGQFSLDQENRQPGMMYMRKESFDGSFVECFHLQGFEQNNLAKYWVFNKLSIMSNNYSCSIF